MARIRQRARPLQSPGDRLPRMAECERRQQRPAQVAEGFHVVVGEVSVRAVDPDENSRAAVTAQVDAGRVASRSITVAMESEPDVGVPEPRQCDEIAHPKGVDR